MTPEAIGRTIQLILAPVVMLSACSVFADGVLNHYTSVSDRLRALARERLELLGGGDMPFARERVDEIDAQVPLLLHRHRLIHLALECVYASIGILVLTMCTIAVTATVSADWVGLVVYGIFVVSVLTMLAGVLLITLEIRTSRRSLCFEVTRVSGLPARVTPSVVTETVRA